MSKNKKFRFDLDVNSNAELCPNPVEFYAAALFEGGSRNTFRTLAGVKEATKIANILFDDVIQAYDCEFTPTDSTLDAKTITPCKVSVMTAICQDQLESSFVADWMKKGSNAADFAPAQFMNYYFDELAKETSEELELLTWQGSTGALGVTGSGYLAECDGLQVRLAADNNVVDVSATASLTVSNVISEVSRVVAAIPTRVRWKRNNLKIWMSPDVAALYLEAVAQQSNEVYVNRIPELQYLGIPIIIAEGMSTKKMVATLDSNLIFATDAAEDVNTIDVVQFRKTTLSTKIGTRTDLKIAFDFVNPTEIVYYS